MKPNISLTILLALSLVIGVLTLNDYGESWDELKLYDYAADSLDAYETWFQHGTIPVTGDRFENYGPFFVMGTRILTKTFTQILPGVQEVDVQHLVYFLTFLVGVWAFHQLAVRWMSRNAASGATLLFMTQPVLWGHAFINPKDIPLLSLFLLSVQLGIRVHDSLFGRDVDPLSKSFSLAWNESSPRTRRRLIIVTLFWLACLAVLFGGTPLIHQWIDSAVRAAANGESSLLAQIVPQVQRVAPEIYTEKFFVLFLWLRAITFLAATGLLLWFYHSKLPVALHALKTILPAGVALGLAVSIRIF